MREGCGGGCQIAYGLDNESQKSVESLFVGSAILGLGPRLASQVCPGKDWARGKDSDDYRKEEIVKEAYLRSDAIGENGERWGG